MSNDAQKKKEQLIELMRKAVEADKELREQFQMGDKFRFIRDRLNALFTQTQESLKDIRQSTQVSAAELADDEVLVYVYLFNTQGISVPTWNKMVNQSVFYEYSVNRPIYAEKSHVEAVIRSKANKAQHAYITIAIKKDALLTVAEADLQKDNIGHPLVRVREGALDVKRVMSFTHNDHEYVLDETGLLVQKS